MASAAVRTKVGVCCLLLLALDVGICVWTFFCNAVLSFPSWFEIISLRKSSSCKFSLSISYGVVCWSVVCDCSISWSYWFAF